MTSEVKQAPLDDDEIAELRTWIARDGEAHVLAAVRLSRGAFTRGLAGLPIQLGSREMVRTALGRRRHAA